MTGLTKLQPESLDQSKSRLIDLSPAGGCGCKIPQNQLDLLLAGIGGDLSSLGVGASGMETRDDAGTVKLESESVVVSIDIQTPVSSSPAVWGRVAAANAMSDIYAMGANPVGAVSFLAWPEDREIDEARELVIAGSEALRRDGAILVGGHSIHSSIPMFGYCVIGAVEDGELMEISQGRAGDVLLLTKPIGVGVAISAEKARLSTPELRTAANETMSGSNRAASHVATAFGIRCATDVTGFGLVGHVHNIARESGLAAVVAPSAVPILDGVSELLSSGFLPDGLARNRMVASAYTDWGNEVELYRNLVSDPQTSGGLLLAVNPACAAAVAAALLRSNVSACEVGRLEAGKAGYIRLSEHL